MRHRGDRFAERRHYGINLAIGERVVERQRDGALGDVFGDREIARAEAEHLTVEGLEMDRREVTVARDAAPAQRNEYRVAIFTRKLFLQTNHVHEPAHLR